MSKMLSVFDYLAAAKPYLRDRWLIDVYPGQILERWPYRLVRKYHCIRHECGGPLTKEDMEMRGGVVPEAMHRWCYRDLIIGITDACFICGDWLEDEKLDDQKNEPGQIIHRLHTGAHHCMEYYSVISCKALGADMRFLLDEKRLGSYEHQVNAGTHGRENSYSCQ